MNRRGFFNKLLGFGAFLSTGLLSLVLHNSKKATGHETKKPLSDRIIHDRNFRPYTMPAKIRVPGDHGPTMIQLSCANCGCLLDIREGVILPKCDNCGKIGWHFHSARLISS